MNPTLEEIKKAAIECRAYEGSLAMGWYMSDRQLQDFASYWMKVQREIDAGICEKQEQEYDCNGEPRMMWYVCAEAIRNNTGELK